MLRYLLKKEWGPIILKEDSDLESNLEELKALLPHVPKYVKEDLERDIFLIEQGVIGEKNVMYELRNSHLPIVVLRDLYYEFEEYSAQIDFLIFTEKHIFIVECKNLYGNIVVDNQGSFVRTLQFGRKKWQESIYSPVTQNTRHKNLLRKVNLLDKSNLISKKIADASFTDNCIPLVVLANPKSYVNMRYAPKDIKSKIIKADQLVKYIRDYHNNSGLNYPSESQAIKRAQWFLDQQTFKENTFLSKYKRWSPNESEVELEEIVENPKIIIDDSIPIEEHTVYISLREYRLQKSREENIKPYYIYNNNQLISIIKSSPTSIHELKSISWMTEVKIKKYGDDIITIIKKALDIE